MGLTIWQVHVSRSRCSLTAKEKKRRKRKGSTGKNRPHELLPQTPINEIQAVASHGLCPTQARGLRTEDFTHLPCVEASKLQLQLPFANAKSPMSDLSLSIRHPPNSNARNFRHANSSYDGSAVPKYPMKHSSCLPYSPQT